MSERATIEERLMRMVEVDDQRGCWAWTGRLTKDGYGQITVSGRNRSAHRVSFEVFRGAIPGGLTLDHLCRNRGCINPDHLDPVTHRENVLRGNAIPALNAAKTHCIHGHPFTPENTGLRKRNGRTWRVCKTCDLRRQTEYQRRRQSGASA